MPSWTHSICEKCWARIHGDRRPHRLHEVYRLEEVCCFCTEPHKSGIYVREDPARTECAHD